MTFRHRVVFSRNVFASENPVLDELLERRKGTKVFVLMERALVELDESLEGRAVAKARNLVETPVGAAVFIGGEECKVDGRIYEKMCDAIAGAGIDRHSYVFAIGGGAFLDVAGFAAATVHRGVRLVRFPTTTLSQDDSGVGVKCGVNKYGKKNFVGAFAVPYAVVNDFSFLQTQAEGVRRAGLVEAVKVALVKDASFFVWIEEHVAGLYALRPSLLEEAVERSAVLHARHIVEGGDPFETGSSRPLDFGHWAAHKLEQLSGFELSHADAVAVGLALDSVYSARLGLLAREDAERVLAVLKGLALPIWHELLDAHDGTGRRSILAGLEEFREHMGGEFTILLLESPGRGVDVHEMDEAILLDAIEELRERVLQIV